jgi:hypothetical protein
MAHPRAVPFISVLAKGRRRITNSSYGGVLNSSLFAQHLGIFPSQISPTLAQRVLPNTLANRDFFLGTTRALHFSVGLCINNSQPWQNATVRASPPVV